MVSLRYCMRGFFKCHFIRIRTRFGFFGDDAGDSSKMRLEGRFSVGIFIVFYDLSDAVWFVICRVHDIRSMIGFFVKGVFYHERGFS